MAEFKYVALTAAGRKTKGVARAGDRNAAVMSLKEEGLYVLSVKEKGSQWWQKEVYFGRKVSSQEFAVFCRQFATIIRAGVSILDAVRMLAQQTESRPLSAALIDLAKGLEKGQLFSRAAADRPDIFPTIFINMVKAGEVSGNLEETLERTAIFFEREYYTREKIKSALTYPVLVSILAVGVTTFLLIAIVPTFVGLFSTYHAELPLPTRIVIGASHFMTGYGWVLAILLVVLIFTDRRLSKRKEYRFQKEILMLRMPVFGKLIQKSLVARMTRTMSSLFASAVPILQSLTIVGEIVDNSVVSQALAEAAASLQEGRSLSAPLGRNKLFPPMVSHMMAIGEQTGSLDVMLTKIADFYEAEVDAMADRLKSLLEPIMILILATIVGTIVTAVILPEFTIISYIH